MASGAIEGTMVDLRSTLIATVRSFSTKKPDERIADQLLDGAVSKLYREAVRLEERQAHGAFFTPGRLAKQMVARLDTTSRIHDPSFGTGNLLLAHAARLPIEATLEETLTSWNVVLGGTEVQPELVEIARLRLILLALRRGARPRTKDTLDHQQWFPALQVGDFLNGMQPLDSNVIMNPPYGSVVPRETPVWSTGRISRAALHSAKAIALILPGRRFSGLLPDVLRSGSRYEGWRKWVAENLEDVDLRIVGQFDDDTDVDVFMLTGRKRKDPSPIASWPASQERGKRLADAFTVRVGTVVPHRHKKTGPSRAFLHAGNAGPNSAISRISESRKFTGRTFDPPFVVIRRTSSPKDKQRIVASLVLGKRPVAVENHLLVALPNSKLEADCRELLTWLGSSEATTHLNEVIRCRHLTVGSIEGLPWEK